MYTAIAIYVWFGWLVSYLNNKCCYHICVITCVIYTRRKRKIKQQKTHGTECDYNSFQISLFTHAHLGSPQIFANFMFSWYKPLTSSEIDRWLSNACSNFISVWFPSRYAHVTLLDLLFVWASREC